MNKLNKYLKKHIATILLVFLYLQPIIDLVTSISLNILNFNISFGIIIRFLFLLFLLYFYLFVKKNITKTKKIYLSFILFFIICFTLMIYFIKDSSAISFELQNVLKIFYLPILLTIVDHEDIKISLNDLVKIASIYLIFIFLPSITGCSFNAYSQGKTGSVGWFNSGNEISAILSILTPFLIYYLLTDHNIFYKLFLSLLIIYCYFIIGSKIIILSLILSLIFNIIIYFKKKPASYKKISRFIGIIIVLIILGVILIPKTNFYQNIIIHLNYLGINKFGDIFSYDFVNRFIFSDRLTYLSNTNLNYIWSKPIEKFLGLGFIESFGTDYVYIKMIEMDFLDIFYRTGIIGFIIYIIPLILNIKILFSQNHEQITKFALILGLIISLLVGHTLTSPGVSIYLLVILKSKNILK